jgi:integral membrane sensor domain MASE1
VPFTLRTNGSILVNRVGWSALGGWLLLAIAYVATALLGFSLAFAVKQVTAVWPPTGIAVAALLLWGPRVWPGIFLGAFASNALAHEPLWTAAAIGASNTLGPLAVVAILRAFGFDNALDRVRDVIALIVAAAAGMTITATNGVAQLALAGIAPWPSYANVWWTWWAGDTVGTLLFAPLILTLAVRSHSPRADAKRYEYPLLLATLAGLSWLVFVSDFTRGFSVYPLLIWIALRSGQRATVVAIVISAGMAVWGTAHQIGAFGGGSLDQRLVSLDSFIAAFAATGMILSAATAERRAAIDRIRSVAETLETAFLPGQLPKRPGLHCDGLYLPAGSEALVGGDWYDVFELADGSLVVSIGDVIGHGLAAAVTASKIRQAVFAAAFDSADPTAVLERVNRVFRSQSDSVATALVAILDAELRTMRYAGAGHISPMISPSVALERLPSSGGLPLGVADFVHSKTHVVDLSNDCAIAFYTDGLVEFDRDVERNEATLAKALAELVADQSTLEPAMFLQRRVMAANLPKDDVALVVVRIQEVRNGGKSESSWSKDTKIA